MNIFEMIYNKLLLKITFENKLTKKCKDSNNFLWKSTQIFRVLTNMFCKVLLMDTMLGYIQEKLEENN